MMAQKKIDLYLVTGFLGSGKTTLMKKILHRVNNRKTAVIMNEFGTRNVDSILLEQNGFILSEINEGSVFCSCKSDAFLDAIWALCEKDIELILVETSGMANPISMPSLLPVIDKKTDRVRYRGCITVASSENIYKLLQTSLFVQGQVKQADVLLLNKTDLVSKEQLDYCEKSIRQWNPDCTIYKTAYCNTGNLDDLLNLIPNQDASPPAQKEDSALAVGSHGPSGLVEPASGSLIAKERPDPFNARQQSAGASAESLNYKKGVAEYSATISPAVKRYLLEMKQPVDQEKLLHFLNGLQQDLYRVKGFAKLPDGTTVFVDGDTSGIRINRSNYSNHDHFLVFIYPDQKPMHYIIQKSYRTTFGEQPA